MKLLLKVLKKVLFHILYFLRPFKKIYLGFGSFVFLVKAIVNLFTGENYSAVFDFLTVFIFYLIGFYYDVLILKLKPEDLNITLY